ncbi:Hsp20/alpha crystallin family protein [Phaeacidiphilus oryzae]|jgi:HSP20 family molecular chaperone IbpA|uniref:Hsp20/alpha crystallin family protein n=1 Tax=Phaeacidiphilus oryzae TaxID=348818 RepID=UPI00055A8AEC|nr:Hsp20/alpha crystallin family protein [Phaeacidiphilus oryzae]
MADSLIPRHRTLFPDLMQWLETGFPGFPTLPVTGGGAEAHAIPIEVDEDEKAGAFVVRAELPGLDPQHDIEITVDGDLLAIRATHTDSRTEKGRSEFRYGSFQRVLRLPAQIPEKGVKAEYRAGILTLTVPMPVKPKEAARTIKVEHLD